MFWNIRKNTFKYHTPKKAKDLVDGLTFDLDENPLKFDDSSEYHILALKATCKEKFSESDVLGGYKIREENGAPYLIE